MTSTLINMVRVSTAYNARRHCYYVYVLTVNKQTFGKTGSTKANNNRMRNNSPLEEQKINKQRRKGKTVYRNAGK